MQATCENESCDKGEWNLRKHPSEYARGVTCPECGTSRVSVEGADGGPHAHQGEQPQQVEQPQQSQTPNRAQTPQTVDQSQQQAQAPQTREQAQGVGGAIQQGMELGETFYAMQSDDPQQQAKARGKLLQTAGSALAKIGEQSMRQQVEQNERAKQANSDDISVAEEYPECPACGAQLTGIPEGQEFPCPSCNTMLEYGN